MPFTETVGLVGPLAGLTGTVAPPPPPPLLPQPLNERTTVITRSSQSDILIGENFFACERPPFIKSNPPRKLSLNCSTVQSSMHLQEMEIGPSPHHGSAPPNKRSASFASSSLLERRSTYGLAKGYSLEELS